jgi:hypothetical protein
LSGKKSRRVELELEDGHPDLSVEEQKLYEVVVI